MKGSFIVRDADGTIREISSEQAQAARQEYAAVLRLTSEIIGGAVRIESREFVRLPQVLLQVLDIHRQFIKDQSKKDDG